ncbi:2-hydroxyacid dehydrogenase [Amaricoccus sp.]|uniref:2-hydroxyacid dehydrogenase n=1 Tax=Amaricoccus sp. TaxID=1872485 RepID=UPI001B59C616|nr:2-hydroxyacid dehydrogenase [Amaricoccus sp.]MBP7003046.1 2-hydroxyacid dehydrogenase [Amaricoccus sp.]
MTKPTVLMTGAYPAWDLDDLEANYRVLKLWEAPDADAFLAEHGAEVRAVATRGDLGASAALMRALPKLEIVACYGVGTDAIDLAHARAAGVRVTNTPDVLTADVADMAVALLLAAARLIPQGDAEIRRGGWAMPLTTRVTGKAVGIVGMGRIGSAVAKRLAAFDCDIAYFGRSRRDDAPYAFEPDLLALARRSEFLVLTLAASDATRGLIDAAVLDALGPDGILVNVSRGSTVDEPALLAALEAGRIKAAGLDVFLNEPGIDPRFAALPNVALAPHHASGTIETRKAMGQLVRDNLAAHFEGRALATPVA